MIKTTTMMTTKILNIGRNPPKISAAGIFDQRSFGVLHEIRYVSTACCPLAVMPIAFFRLEFDYVFFFLCKLVNNLCFSLLEFSTGRERKQLNYHDAQKQMDAMVKEETRQGRIVSRGQPANAGARSSENGPTRFLSSVEF